MPNPRDNDLWYNLSIPSTSCSENHGIHGNPPGALLPGVHHWLKQWMSLDLRSTSSRCGKVLSRWYLGSELDPDVSQTGNNSKSDLSHFARVWSTYWLPFLESWLNNMPFPVSCQLKGVASVEPRISTSILQAAMEWITEIHQPTFSIHTTTVNFRWRTTSFHSVIYQSIAPDVCPEPHLHELAKCGYKPQFRCHFGPPCHPCYLGSMPIGKETSWFS